jgi:MoaA/NifB/PqqE/SkfB family radical SAM enzyme
LVDEYSYTDTGLRWCPCPNYVLLRFDFRVSRFDLLVHPIRYIADSTVEVRILRNAKVVSSGGVRAEPCEVSGGGESEIEDQLSHVGEGDRVVFSGNDVTTRDELPQWVRQAKAAGAKQVIVQADGTSLAFEGYVRALKEAGVDVFATSLHGAIAPMHDWVSQDSGSFMTSVRGIQNVRKVGGTMLVNSVLVRSNFRHAKELVAVCNRLGVRAIRLLWPVVKGLPAEHTWGVVPDPEVVRPYILEAEAVAARAGLRLQVELPELDESEPASSPMESE